MLVVCVFKMNNRNLRQRNVNRQLNNDRPPDRQAKLDGLEFIAKLFENKKDAKGNVVEKSKLQKLVDDETNLLVTDSKVFSKSRHPEKCTLTIPDKTITTKKRSSFKTSTRDKTSTEMPTSRRAMISRPSTPLSSIC